MKAEERAAVVLAAGSGTRMNAACKKQYLHLAGRPLLYYSLKVLEEFGFAQVILVVGAGEEVYCRKEILEAYGIHCVSDIVTGGAKRSDSVYAGLCAVRGCKYVYIHDGARPCIQSAMLGRLTLDAEAHGACVAAVPVKDTIKQADGTGFVASTPKRELLWTVQTPQVFEYDLAMRAYTAYMESPQPDITDDAMVVEQYLHIPVKLTMGEYTNIKVTTNEDLPAVELYIKESYQALCQHE